MTPEDKIKYVKRQIDEIAKISPKGPVHIELFSLTEYEDGPTILFNQEQKTIIKKLEEDGYIKNVFFQDDGVGVWVELIQEEKEKKIIPIPKKQPIIKAKGLELIAIEIANLDSGPNLIEFLTGCGVDRNIIEYPQTKWRMIYDVLLALATSEAKKDRKTLFMIIEEACHPLMHKGNKSLSEETKKKFNGFLEYDNFSIDEKGILWQGYEYGNNFDWADKDGRDFTDTIENRIYTIFPDKVSELYVYWNELIELTKFYLKNKESQNKEANDIYFELIRKIENLLHKNGCGGLKDKYKRPFGNMIGCEFEAQKKGITADSLLVELYDFLSEITRLSLPYKEYIEKLKKDDADFLARINIYIEQNSKKTEKPENTNQEQKSKEQESPITRIEIVSLPELRVKGSGETNKSDKPIKQTSLKSANIAYNDDEPSITINEQKVAIPPYKNEHYLCRTMYEYKKDEAIDWSIIWEKMAGYDNTPDKPEAKKEDWHTAYDTLRAVNKRIQECVNTKDNLFIWKNKTIKRNY